MTDMKKCIALIDDMFKGISFDITKPIEMNQHSRHYSPYKFVDGGYLPYDSSYWRQQGKITQTFEGYNSYYRNDQYLRKYGAINKSLNDAIDHLTKAKKKKKGRCWDGYEPVPGKEPYSEDSCKKVSKSACKDKPVNKPFRSSAKGKKKTVCVSTGDGKKKAVHYGAKGYKHNYSEGANDNFHARHNCADKKDKTKAGYWACKDLWPKGKKKGTGATAKSDIIYDINDALDHLAKGGPGSGRTKSAFKESYLDDIAHKYKMEDIVARKDKERAEKDKKKKEDKAKPAKEKHNADVRRLVSYLKSEESMENDEKLLKSLGFTSEPVNLISEIKEDESISKAIQEGNIQPHGRHDLNWHERPNQVILKAYGSEYLKDNHGEKVHKDNDKKMEKEVSKIEEIEMPEEEKAPKSRKLADAFTGKSEVHDALNSLMKAEEAEEVEETEGEEVDEAQAEAVKELKDSRIKGTEAGAEEESFKSSNLSDLAKACGDYMEAAMGKDYAKMDKKGKKKKVDEEMKESKEDKKEEA